jgi:hypothetical protein
MIVLPFNRASEATFQTAYATTVIARSESDEAIHLSLRDEMDCFVAEPVIGRAFARPVGSQ